jgi:hypothetical protein
LRKFLPVGGPLGLAGLLADSTPLNVGEEEWLAKTKARREAAQQYASTEGGPIEKAQGGVAGEPVNIAADGLMAGADPAMQAAVAERDMVPTSPDQPQDAEERAVYDRALLALQGQLENEEAQRAVDEFIEVFGPQALAQLEVLVNQPRDRGGIVETASGQDTVGMTEEEITAGIPTAKMAGGGLAQQGPDVIPGKIVDPMTGRQTANLLVGENEYIEPADSLSRRAMAAGMEGTPHNGAIVRGREEDQLRQMYG